MELDNPLFCVHEESEPHGFLDYLICTLAQNFVSYLRVDRWNQREPHKRLANIGSSCSVELLSEEFVEGGRKIARRKVRMIGVRGQPKHGWPTMSQHC